MRHWTLRSQISYIGFRVLEDSLLSQHARSRDRLLRQTSCP